MTLTISEETLDVLRNSVMFELRNLKESGSSEFEVRALIDAANEIGCNVDWETLDVDCL
jgi:hypothetical protein